MNTLVLHAGAILFIIGLVLTILWWKPGSETEAERQARISRAIKDARPDWDFE